MATVVERVDSLEEVVKNFVRDVGVEFNKLYNVQVRTELELQALKEDTQAFKDEMIGALVADPTLNGAEAGLFHEHFKAAITTLSNARSIDRQVACAGRVSMRMCRAVDLDG